MIYDSVKLSADNTGEQPTEDVMLCSQARDKLGSSLFVEATIDYKYLINNYPDFDGIGNCLYDLYSCYQGLDTNYSYEYRTGLYTNLKNYLTEKIESSAYENNTVICDIAFDIIIMCEANMQEFSSAAIHCEFIAHYHPDPDIRLVASWNYLEIQELINSGNGGGGSQLQIANDKLQVEELQELKQQKRMNEILSDDPLMSKIKKIFDKNSEERKMKIEKQIMDQSSSSEELKTNLKKSSDLDKQKGDRAKRNLFSQNLNAEEKEKRMLEDISMTITDIRSVIENNSVVKSLPLEYKLSQNYPNPFNPSTTIEFQLPSDGLVKLKVYDVSGREIKTLVNEFKTAGSYNILFDGINLASGVYFYRLESNKFVQTKRMVLVK